MDTVILVDIDGVLATKNMRCLLTVYNRVLKLGIQDDTLARVRTRDVFDMLPEVKAYRAKVGVNRYHYQLEALRWYPDAVITCNVIDGSWQGVRYLAQRVSALKYCTARVINFNAEWNTDLARVTWIWLKNNAFPHAEQILFCDGVKEKLTKIVAMIQEQGQHILLIDDCPDKLLKAFGELSGVDQNLLSEHLTLAAFGYDECDQDYLLNIIPFPSWKEVVNLAVEKELNYAKESRWQRE
jgi:hypothetical protein